MAPLPLFLLSTRSHTQTSVLFIWRWKSPESLRFTWKPTEESSIKRPPWVLHINTHSEENTGAAEACGNARNTEPAEESNSPGSELRGLRHADSSESMQLQEGKLSNLPLTFLLWLKYKAALQNILNYKQVSIPQQLLRCSTDLKEQNQMLSEVSTNCKVYLLINPTTSEQTFDLLVSVQGKETQPCINQHLKSYNLTKSLSSDTHGKKTTITVFF